VGHLEPGLPDSTTGSFLARSYSDGERAGREREWKVDWNPMERACSDGCGSPHYKGSTKLVETQGMNS
jgi:hypothetical protein